jgi:hypothetical protein
MKMKFLATFVAALGVCLASAQLYPSKLSLLSNTALRLGDPRVQFEVGLGEDQRAEVSKLMASQGAKQMAISKELAKAKPDQYATIQAKLDKSEVATAKSILNVLNVGQRERVMQLAIQNAGAFALRDATVAKKVGITPEQKTKVLAILAKTAAAMEELDAKLGSQLEAAPKGKAGDKKRLAIVKAFEPKHKAIDNNGQAEILALLSKAQLDSWKKAKGKAFKL